MPVLELDDAIFDDVVGGSDTPVLVEFMAPWCRPCTMLAPVLEQVAAEQEGRLVVATVDADANLAVRRRHDVTSTPTLVLFVDGQPRRRLVGARGKARLVKELAEFL